MKKNYILLFFVCLFFVTTSFAKDEGVSLRDKLENNSITQGSAISLEVHFPSVFVTRKGLTVKTSQDGKTTENGAQFIQTFDKIEPVKLDAIFGKTALANATGALNTKVDQLYDAVSQSLHLCRGEEDDAMGLVDPPAETAPINEMHKKLHHCARYHPDQFSALTNIMQPFMEWRQSEASNLLKLYLAKLTSDRLMDRLEGRLMLNCLMKTYGTGETEFESTAVVGGKEQKTTEAYATPKDTAESLVHCSNPENWNLHTLFPVLSRKTCMHTNLKNNTDTTKTGQENLEPGPGMTEIGEYLSDEEGGYYEFDEKTKEYKRLDEDYAATLSKDAPNKDEESEYTKYMKGNLYRFSLPYFIETCILTENTVEFDESSTEGGELELPDGIKLAAGIPPFAELEIERKITKAKDDKGAETDEVDLAKSFATLKLSTYPMSLSTEEIYDVLYVRAFTILSSEWFGSGQSQGWFPSPFAPKNKWIKHASNKTLSEEDIAFLRQFSSIRMPVRLIAKIQQTGKKTAPYYWRMLAQKIAAIQTLEVLYGSTMILQEAHRVLTGVDSEFTVLLNASVEIMKVVVKAYATSLNLADATTLVDILESIERRLSVYNHYANAEVEQTEAFFKGLKKKADDYKMGKGFKMP